MNTILVIVGFLAGVAFTTVVGVLFAPWRPTPDETRRAAERAWEEHWRRTHTAEGERRQPDDPAYTHFDF